MSRKKIQSASRALASIGNTRASIQNQVKSNTRLQAVLHGFVTSVIALNAVLVLYAVISIAAIMTVSGSDFIDSLPLALYILPLIVLMGSMVLSYHRHGGGLVTIIILIVESVFFLLLSSLIRGFIVLMVLSILAIAIVLVLGSFRLHMKKRELGKKGILWFTVLNILGLSFPVSVYLMGQTPIATVYATGPHSVFMSVPLDGFDIPYRDLVPSSELIVQLNETRFGLDFRMLEGSGASWTRLTQWLIALNNTPIKYSLTLTFDRFQVVGQQPQLLGSTDLFRAMFTSHEETLSQLSAKIQELNLTGFPEVVKFDVTLSNPEWQILMLRTRNVDLYGFASLLRLSLDAINGTDLEYRANSLIDKTHTAGFKCGMVVESFVLDDLQDTDSVSMEVSGVTHGVIDRLDSCEVLCSRSRMSVEMLGDVGEYLVHSYSRTAARIHPPAGFGMRLGIAGNETDIYGRVSTVYGSMKSLATDVTIATGNGARNLTVESLPSLLHSYGPDALHMLKTTIEETLSAEVAYTFRIYAFRAVFMAIDAFDLLML